MHPPPTGPHLTASVLGATDDDPEGGGLFGGAVGARVRQSLLTWLRLDYRLGLGGGNLTLASSQQVGTFLLLQRLELAILAVQYASVDIPLVLSLQHIWLPPGRQRDLAYGGHALGMGLGVRFEF